MNDAPPESNPIDANRVSAERLMDHLRGLGDLAIAFSGGVDSSVVAVAAVRAGVKRAIAVTADSASLSSDQLETARRVASEIGIEHRVIATDEGEREEYLRNDGRRCFYCKETLYRSLASIAAEFAPMQLISGTNADDLGDYRPGLQAGSLAGVRTPLADLGLTKSDVRGLAGWFGLSNRDLPAAPCLASRIAYGTRVTAERLRAIERAEAWLRERGFRELRVRLHEGDLARIEVPRHQIAELFGHDQDGAMTKAMTSFGFKFVTIDTQGFRSGNLNEMLVSILPESRATKRATS